MNCVLDFYCFEFVEAFAGDFFVYVIFVYFLLCGYL